MRIGRVMGNLTMTTRLADLKPGNYLLVDVLDAQALTGLDKHSPRSTPMPESLVVFDQLGAGVGQLVAISEGAEATQPLRPDRVPIDAYAAAILDEIQINHQVVKTSQIQASQKR